MNTFDTHAHLDHLDNLDQALSEAKEAGVTGVVTVGVDLASNKKNLQIKKSTKEPNIYVALGIHPGNINPEETQECVQFIRENIDQAIAIGETGLDYWYKWVRKNLEEREKQHKVFAIQLELAKEFDLPVIIHSRGAWKESLAMTKGAGVKKALFHWYSGPVKVLEAVIESGYYVSTTPALAYSPQSREAISQAPIERTLIETDCPVWFKDGEESFSSTPKDVFRTLKAYAALKNIDEQAAVKIFNQNAKEFFGLNQELE